jgi:dihydropteroate synthase
MKLRLRDSQLDLSMPAVMGVLNVTPDSFSDGGDWSDVSRACDRAWRMAEEGAAIIDIGGESTRPGAQPVSQAEELERVIPVIERLTAERFSAFISIDSIKPEVMRAAVTAGASMINDVNALRASGALEVAAQAKVAVCLMHMQGNPLNMQKQPSYTDVVAEIGEYLSERAGACMDAGISQDRIVLDPGFGFGKSLEHNLTLLASLKRLSVARFPLLVGMSRKSMLGAILGVPTGERGHGHSAAVAIAVLQGAKIIRTHEVQASLHAIKVADRVRRSDDKGELHE